MRKDDAFLNISEEQYALVARMNVMDDPLFQKIAEDPEVCEEILRNDTAIMYSFPPYLERNVFPNLVHIPIKDKQATFMIYAALNKNIDKSQLALARAFINVFSEYLWWSWPAVNSWQKNYSRIIAQQPKLRNV